MILGRLRHSLHGRNFGQNIGQQSSLIQQFEAVARSAVSENADQFIANPLRGYPENQAMQPADGPESLRLDLIVEPRREAHGAQEAQVILAKARFGITNGAHHSVAEVGLSTDEVQYLVAIRIEQ